MFIRKKTKFDPRTKKAYHLYQLVESVRTERGPRQRILLSLSPDIGITDDKDLKLLANRIEEIFTGSSSFVSGSEEIEQLAERYASQLLHRLSEPTPSNDQPAEEPDYQSIDKIGRAHV